MSPQKHFLMWPIWDGQTNRQVQELKIDVDKRIYLRISVNEKFKLNRIKVNIMSYHAYLLKTIQIQRITDAFDIMIHFQFIHCVSLK